MKINFVDAFSLWSSHRFSSQYHGCSTLWYVNNGWCSVNGKTTKKTNEYCFVLISVLLWVRIKPIYLNDALCSKFVCTCADVDVCVYLCVCWTTELLLSPLLADRPLTLFSLFVDGAPPARRRDKRAHHRNAAVVFSATLRPKGMIRRSRLDFLFPHFTDKKKKITYLHLHLVFSLILPVPQSFLLRFLTCFPFF